jgi:hypothetical protein
MEAQQEIDLNLANYSLKFQYGQYESQIKNAL